MLSEILILTLKGVIYLTGKDWSEEDTITPLQMTFLFLHAIRAVFPLTLMRQIYQ